jgi:hypothetical protein
MPYGLPWSEEFVQQLAEKGVRDEFVADQIRSRVALLIRALREQEDRDWTQAELGERAGKRQNVICRIEDPDYGRLSLQTLLDVAAAFDLPLWIDIPEWEDWFRLIGDVPNSKTARSSFNLGKLATRAARAKNGISTGTIGSVYALPLKQEGTATKADKVDGFIAQSISA